jgi:NAD(P)-dependent dehydrogenase (short-subunit alcohol dehydrogenase family)
MSGQQTLAGRTAWVSGGAGGIGAACAKFLLRDGAAVLIMGRREEALQRVRKQLLQAVPAGRVDIFAGDGGKEADVQAALKQAHGMLNRLDMLIPTVGGAAFRPLLEQDAATMHDEFHMNIVTAFLAIRYGVPLMQPGGSIVCISSTAAAMPFGSLSSYCTSKAGLEMFVRCAAEELGARKIRVNAVRPGMTRNSSNDAMFANAKLIGKFLAEIPLGRTGEPEDIAGAVRYLAGPESSWVTGQSFAADGGHELRKHPDLSAILRG